MGRLHTCYSPVRRSPPEYCYSYAAPRLACVKPIASVHPEPGSNSSLFKFFVLSLCQDVYPSILSLTVRFYPVKSCFLYYYFNSFKERFYLPSFFLAPHRYGVCFSWKAGAKVHPFTLHSKFFDKKILDFFTDWIQFALEVDFT